LQILTVILFAVSSNLDNLVLGLSYGLKGVHIPVFSSLLMGTITLIGTIFSMVLGQKLLPFLPGGFSRLLGSVIILLMGGYGMVSFIIKSRKSGYRQEDENLSDSRLPPRLLQIREAFVLGMALAANNIGLGIGASMSGLGVIPASVGSFCFSIAFLTAGNRAGKRWFSGLIGRYAEPAASVVMLILGLYELFS